MNDHSLILIRFRSVALREEMHLIARLRQFAAGPMEHTSIIDRVTVTDVTNSQHTPQNYKISARAPQAGVAYDSLNFELRM